MKVEKRPEIETKESEKDPENTTDKQVRIGVTCVDKKENLIAKLMVPTQLSLSVKQFLALLSGRLKDSKFSYVAQELLIDGFTVVNGDILSDVYESGCQVKGLCEQFEDLSHTALSPSPAQKPSHPIQSTLQLVDITRKLSSENLKSVSLFKLSSIQVLGDDGEQEMLFQSTAEPRTGTTIPVKTTEKEKMVHQWFKSSCVSYATPPMKLSQVLLQIRACGVDINLCEFRKLLSKLHSEFPNLIQKQRSSRKTKCFRFHIKILCSHAVPSTTLALTSLALDSAVPSTTQALTSTSLPLDSAPSPIHLTSTGNLENPSLDHSFSPAPMTFPTRSEPPSQDESKDTDHSLSPSQCTTTCPDPPTQHSSTETASSSPSKNFETKDSEEKSISTEAYGKRVEVDPANSRDLEWAFNDAYWRTYQCGNRKKFCMSRASLPRLEIAVAIAFHGTPKYALQFPDQWSMISKTPLSSSRESLRSVLILAFPPLPICKDVADWANRHFKLELPVEAGDLWPQWREIRASRDGISDNPPPDWDFSNTSKSYKNWCEYLEKNGHSIQPEEEWKMFGFKVPTYQQSWAFDILCDLYCQYQGDRGYVKHEKRHRFQLNQQIVNHFRTSAHSRAMYWFVGEKYEQKNRQSRGKVSAADIVTMSECLGITDSKIVATFSACENNVVLKSNCYQKWLRTPQLVRCPLPSVVDCQKPCPYNVWKKVHTQLWEQFKREVTRVPLAIYIPTGATEGKILSVSCAKYCKSTICGPCSDIKKSLEEKLKRRLQSGSSKDSTEKKHPNGDKSLRVQVKPTKESWDRVLRTHCGEGHYRLVIDLIDFIRKRKYLEKPIQFQVLANLLQSIGKGKIVSTSDIVFKLGFLLRRRLGHSAYLAYKDIYCLPSESTIKNHIKSEPRTLGYQPSLCESMLIKYLQEKLMDSLDDGRVSRTMRAGSAGPRVNIYGPAMPCDWREWERSILDLDHLKKEALEKGEDIINLLRQKCEDIMKSKRLAAHIGLHLITCTSADIPGLIAVVHALPQSGMTYAHRAEIVLETRRRCFLDAHGGIRKVYPALIGLSADLFFLSLLLAFVNWRLYKHGYRHYPLGIPSRFTWLFTLVPCLF